MALDTNVLARLLLDDTPDQSALSRALMAHVSADRPAFVGREALAELVWVLSSRGRLPRAAVAEALGALLEAREIRVEEAEDVGRAIRRQGPGAPGVADLMILAAARREGRRLWTFDRALAREPGARLLEAGVL